MSDPGSQPAAITGVRALWWSDYTAHCDRKGAESTRRRLALAPLRLFINPSLRAVLLLRVANASPRASWWVWRNLLVHGYAMDWSGRLEIGPRFEIPHPVGILLAAGSQIGSDVGLAHNVTLAGERGPGRPTIGDGVTVYPGAVLIGGVTVGAGSIVGANSVVMRDVPPGRMVTPRGTVPLEASTRHGDQA